MRGLKVVLALVAVLAMAGTTLAGFTWSVEATSGFSSTVLDSWLVRVGGSKTFTNMNIRPDVGGVPDDGSLGIVHQVNEFGGYPAKAQKTLWTGLMMPTSEPYDTHFQFAYDAPRLDLANVASETNTQGTSPTGIEKDSANFYYGLGTLSALVTDGFTLPAELPAETAFMQVVIPTGTRVWLTGVTVVAGENIPVEIPIGVIPEPGTVGLLIGGALCLLVVRLRKK